MDDNRLVVYEIYKAPPVRAVDRFSQFKRNAKRRFKKKQSRKDRKENFKDDFLNHFGLDKGQFTVNLIKTEDRWYVEICNKKTQKCVRHDYDVVCSIMDKNCRLPETYVGFNVDVEV